MNDLQNDGFENNIADNQMNDLCDSSKSDSSDDDGKLFDDSEEEEEEKEEKEDIEVDRDQKKIENQNMKIDKLEEVAKENSNIEKKVEVEEQKSLEEDDKLFSDDSSSSEDGEEDIILNKQRRKSASQLLEVPPPARFHPNDPRASSTQHHNLDDSSEEEDEIIGFSNGSSRSAKYARPPPETNDIQSSSSIPLSQNLDTNTSYNSNSGKANIINNSHTSNNRTSLISNMPKQILPPIEKKLAIFRGEKNTQSFNARNIEVLHPTHQNNSKNNTSSSLIRNMPIQQPPTNEEKLSNSKLNKTSSLIANMLPQPTPQIEQKLTKFNGDHNMDVPQSSSPIPSSMQQTPLSSNAVEVTEESSYTISPATSTSQQLPTKYCQIVEEKENMNQPDPKIEHITEVQWAGSNDKLSEAAPSPIYDWNDDPCGCTRDGTGAKCCIDLSCVLFACQEECRSNCEAGDLCGNQRITKKQWKKVEVIDAKEKGRGLRTLEKIKKYDFIIEYVGVAVEKKYLDNLFLRYKNERMLYIMGLDNNIYLDARKKGGLARYINHSCDPNCAVHRWKVRGVSRAGIFANRDIEAGEELGFDYKWDRKRGRAPTKCYCGADNCRGTIELPRETSLEDEELETQLKGHWKVPKSFTARHEIINRTIKVYFEGDHEYFVADVAKYNEVTKTHCLMYRQDPDEHWEDLSKEQWMILDEEMEQFVIARKQKRTRQEEQKFDTAKIKNWVIVQTPMKAEILKRHLVDRCQRHYRVQITVSQCVATPDLRVNDDEEAIEENKALQESLDGTAWKFTISGMHPEMAQKYLVLNVKEIVKSQQILGKTIEFKKEKIRLEIVMPRCIVDDVKARLNLMRSSCKNVEITFTHSDSISKQFAKLIIEGEQEECLLKAQTILWKEILTICHAVKAPLTPNGLFKDFGFLGGVLSRGEFNLLFNNASGNSLMHSCSESLSDSTFFAAFQTTHRCTIWVQSEEDMGRINSKNQKVSGADSTQSKKIFFGCEPKRIPELWNHLKNRSEELQRGVRFFNYGSDRIYHNQIQRNFDSKRCGGAYNNFFEYVHATTGAHVKEDFITKNHLRIDGGTLGSNEVVHIDGTAQNELECRIRLAEEMIKLQIELLRDNRTRQQRWCFGRDWSLFVARQNKKPEPLTDGNSKISSMARPLSPRPGGSGSTRVITDSRNIAGACIDIADVNESLGLDSNIAAHACIILYRFLHQILKEDTSNITSLLKLREHSVACLFLSIKCQKACKWKRLEAILEAAYKHFYPTSSFNPKTEQAQVWEKRVLAAEHDILNSLDHDIFWSGVEWISVTAEECGQMSRMQAKTIMEISISGPSLAAGPLLWLKLGPQYVFAAIAALQKISIDYLFAALSLIPRQLSEALDLILASIELQSSNKHLSSKIKTKQGVRNIFFGGTKPFIEIVEKIQNICKDNHSYNRASTTFFGSAKQNQIIARRSCRRRQIRSVDVTLIKDILLPQIQKICAETHCSIYFQQGLDASSEDIIIEGSWRGIAFAEHLLRRIVHESSNHAKSENANDSYSTLQTRENVTSMALESKIDTNSNHNGTIAQKHSSSINFNDQSPSSNKCLPPAVDLGASQNSLMKFQPKMEPGIMTVSELDGTAGWEGTNEPCWNGKIGGKTCIAARALEEVFHNAGLRWWLPKRYLPSLTGLICDMFSIRRNVPGEESQHVDSLARIARLLTPKCSKGKDLFPFLNSLGPDNGVCVADDEKESRRIALSLQRWPTEKMEARERSKGGMGIGFSPSALQEMQLLHQLHYIIPSPQGHPNFVLPIALAIADESQEEKATGSSESYSSDQLFLLRMKGEINESHKDTKEPKTNLSGSYMLFHPTPIILQKVMGKGKKKSTVDNKIESTTVIPPAIFAAWFHDILSALAHCHANHVILRTLHPDQILIDQSGVAKLSGLSRCMVLHPDNRGQYHDPMKSIKSRSKGVTEDDVRSNPYMAPELLLGATQYTQETDMWTLGCLMAHLLLNKPLFSGRERISKMRAIFKIVGMPSKTNYEDATLYPHFEVCKPATRPGKPEKKYKKDVEKALRFLLKQAGICTDEYSGALNLLERILDLDPKKRISAADALEHPYMQEFVNQSALPAFQEIFVQDWVNLKEKIFTSNRVKEDEFMMRENRFLPMYQEKDLKRKLLLMEASSGAFNEGENDDLYNMDDILMSESQSKKAKM